MRLGEPPGVAVGAEQDGLCAAAWHQLPFSGHFGKISVHSLRFDWKVSDIKMAFARLRGTSSLLLAVRVQGSRVRRSQLNFEGVANVCLPSRGRSLLAVPVKLHI